jgi:hypothetical protein
MVMVGLTGQAGHNAQGPARAALDLHGQSNHKGTDRRQIAKVIHVLQPTYTLAGRLGAEFLEAAGDHADHQVLHFELDLAVAGVYGPGGGGCGFLGC